jgi:hypothetical protein
VFHDLKSWPDYFQPIWDGRKRFDMRRDDRPFKPGDTVRLREYLPESQAYTGRVLVADIAYVQRPHKGCPVLVSAGFVILSLASPHGKHRGEGR